MTVLLDISGGVATVTLNRPERRNAYGPAMKADLAAALDRCAGDDDVRAIVLTGAPPAFCAGADMEAGNQTFGAASTTFSAKALPRPLWDIPKPVIAAVNGHAIGVGLTLALQCDMRFFAADAKYGVVQARRGVMGDAQSHWTLPRLVGAASAAEILLTGRTFDGAEARELGICSRVLPNDDVLPAALELARDLAANTAPLSVAYSKRLLWDTWDLTAEEVAQRETDEHVALMGSPDAIEGVAAFLERRPPRWNGSVREGLLPRGRRPDDRQD